MNNTKSILLTGSTGFLGKVIFKELKNTYEITTIGREPNSSKNINFDFNSSDDLKIQESNNLIVHCAGKAHSIPKTKIEKEVFFKINTEGTEKLLKALDSLPQKPEAFVFISTVAVYGLLSGKDIVENSPLNAIDPYGKSKILAEILIENWCLKNNIICTILRLPLVVGKNPKGNLASMINGISKGYYMNFGGGQARKSMVLAEDVAKFIPKVAKIGGTFNLTDGYHPNFKELSQLIAKQLGKSEPFNLPKRFIYILAKIGDLFGSTAPINTIKFKKITSDLTFDDLKARKLANWNPTPVLKGFKIK